MRKGVKKAEARSKVTRKIEVRFGEKHINKYN
jgi:hypothetical protein